MLLIVDFDDFAIAVQLYQHGKIHENGNFFYHDEIINVKTRSDSTYQGFNNKFRAVSCIINVADIRF